MWPFSKDSLKKRIQNASKEELQKMYDEERLKWIETDYYKAAGGKSYEMVRIERAMDRILEEEWENDPSRNKDPNFRWTDVNRWENADE